MRKENVLVLVLIVLALAGGGLYFKSKMGKPPILTTVSAESGTEEKNSSKTQATAIDWNDYTPGMAMARKESKPIFLYFHAPWCTYCTKLKETTFKEKKILAYLEKNFVSIQVDTDQNQAISKEWKVKGLPTMWFLESDGTKINSIPGYMDGAQLLQILKYISTKSYSTMEFKDFVKQ
jgi:thioredoxin-related protein